MEEEIEVWKECGESEKCVYYVSNFGRVKSVTKGLRGGKEKILKQTPKTNGYLRVSINNKTQHTHSLVALAFIGERPKELYIDHIDRNKLNNRANNLRYCTRSENQQNRDDYRTDILETDPKERLKIRKRLDARKYREKKLNNPTN